MVLSLDVPSANDDYDIDSLISDDDLYDEDSNTARDRDMFIVCQ